MSYDQPNYTQMPNVLLDEHIPNMNLAAIRVATAIARQTFGWHREEKKLSLSLLQTLTNLSRQGVIDGIQECMEIEILERRKSPDGSYIYRLLVNEVDQEPDEEGNKVVNDLDQGSQQNRPGGSTELTRGVNDLDQEVVNEVDPLKRKGTTKKDPKETNPPNPPKKTDGGGAGKPEQPTSSRNAVDLLTDPDIGVQPEIAAKLAENLEWELTLRHCCAYLQDLNAGRVEGVGVLVHRLRKGRDTNPVTPVAQRYDFYKRHVPPGERSQHSLAPEKDFVGEYSEIVRT